MNLHHAIAYRKQKYSRLINSIVPDDEPDRKNVPSTSTRNRVTALKRQTWVATSDTENDSDECNISTSSSVAADVHSSPGTLAKCELGSPDSKTSTSRPHSRLSNINNDEIELYEIYEARMEEEKQRKAIEEVAIVDEVTVIEEQKSRDVAIRTAVKRTSSLIDSLDESYRDGCPTKMAKNSNDTRISSPDLFDTIRNDTTAVRNIDTPLTDTYNSLDELPPTPCAISSPVLKLKSIPKIVKQTSMLNFFDKQ